MPITYSSTNMGLNRKNNLQENKLLERIFFMLGYFFLSVTILSRLIESNKISLLVSVLVSLLAYFFIKPKTIRKIKGKEKSHPVWVFALSIFGGLFYAIHLLETTNLQITNFTGRTIGITVLEGINVSARSSVYALSVIIFIFVFSITYFVYSRIDQYIPLISLSSKPWRETKIILYLSSFSIFMYAFHYLNGSNIYINILNIFLLLLFLMFIFLGIKIYGQSKNILSKTLDNYNLLILSFIFPIVVFFCRWAIVDGSYIFSYQYIPIYIFLWISFWVLIFLLNLLLPKKIEVLIDAILSGAIPLLLIPLSAPISNEIQFSISAITSVSASLLSKIIALVFVVVGASIFIVKMNRKKIYNEHFYAKNYYLPIVIATMVIFYAHVNYINLPSHLDLFHHGENLLSVQQLFSFGKIPFINLYPTHGLSYFLTQALFSLADGYRMFEPWLWEWIIKVIEIILLYFILKIITKDSLLTSLIILFLPILGVFGGKPFAYGYNTNLTTTYYFASFATALSIVAVLKKPTYRKLILHWIINFLLLAWRIDFGLTSIIASFFIFFSIILANRMHKKTSVVNLVTVLNSFIVVCLFFALLFVSVAYWKGKNPFEIINQIIWFVKIQADAQGLVNVFSSINSLAIFQYLFLPLIAIFYISFFIQYLVKNRLKDFREERWLILFLSLFSLIMSVRSVQRQTLSVLGYNPYLFAFLWLCLPFFLKIKKKYSIIIFLLMLFIYQLILPNYTSILKPGRIVNLHNWHDKESRISINDYQYKNISTFLKKNLKEDQTFLDLTSSPLLYVVTDKEFVGYFIPSAYYTSDLIQNYLLDEIDKAYVDKKIPLVIFEQPDEYANNIDGVPNEIRSYRIYEYIYGHYKPFGYVDNYMIWVSNDVVLPYSDEIILLSEIDQSFNLKNLPYIWANYDKNLKSKDRVVLASLLDEELLITQNELGKIFINNKIDKSTGNYLYLKIETESDCVLRISYGKSPESNVNINLKATGKEEDYLIRISSQWKWLSEDIDILHITATNNIRVSGAYVLKGD